MVRDYCSPEMKPEEREITLDNVEVRYQSNFDTQKDATVIIGKSRLIFNDSFIHLNNRLSLFDVVLIEINGKQYFGVVVCVQQIKTDEPKQNKIRESTAATSPQPVSIELEMNIAIYVSDECGKIVSQYQTRNETNQLRFNKVTNITSSARMINAIHKVEKWPRYRSLLRPNFQDPYLQLPEITKNDRTAGKDLKNFNKGQCKIIDIAQKNFDDEQDRLFMVFGPPGTGKSRTIAGTVLQLRRKLYENNKILICAPSNGACDELMRRILDEFKRQEIPYDNNILLRIGGVPPNDETLCEHFLEFRILSKIFESIQKNPKEHEFNTHKIGQEITNNAQIVVSTLNHCASSRMQLLKNHVDFIIIDESCQSLEADCLNVFRFGCTKIMMVADPKQLPPTVMSQTGQNYHLNISLYDRLYQNLKMSQLSPIKMLIVQYRMHRDICEFPNLCFYGGELITPPTVDKRSKEFPLRRLYFYNLATSAENEDEHSSKWNEIEAFAVRKLCHMLIDYLEKYRLANGCSLNLQPEISKSIGIITPYNGQLRFLKNLNLPVGIEVMTVDGAQGKEKDIIIYSCVRDNDKNIGFLEDERRLNVALTRAREALYVVGNLTKIAKNSHNGCWAQMVRYAVSKDKNIIEDLDNDIIALPIIKTT